mmetsp:Transcript_51298/g.111831  ORF Transcript_51298/g.111831 Transcript_51298/m.111831 type:complete len:240 (-) Transcript_51298:55-774(-)
MVDPTGAAMASTASFARSPRAARARRGALPLALGAGVLALQLSGVLLGAFVSGPGGLSPRLSSSREPGQALRLRPTGLAASDQDLEDVLARKLKNKGNAAAADDDDDDEEESTLSESAQRAMEKATGIKRKKKKQKAPEDISKKIVKKSLDEVLASASDESDRVGTLARRDVYKEVGITQAEVEAYWDRREEASDSFVDKLLAPSYLGFVVVACLLGWSVYDSFQAPQENVLNSMTGLD